MADATVQPRQVGRVGVLGAGIMGAGIAGAHIRKGIPVMLLDAVPKALEKGVEGLADKPGRGSRRVPRQAALPEQHAVSA